MYALLQQAGIDTPVYGNQGGSYLTMKSNGGLVFGAATILSGFSGVFCDQGAIHSRNVHNHLMTIIHPKDIGNV